MGVNGGYASRPPNSEGYRLLPLAKLIEQVYYYKHMAPRSPYHQGQNHKATEATRCLMPENQKKTPCARLPKRNPDSKPNSDTTPTSDGQIQRPEMTGNGREIEISELTFRQQAALPRIALAQSLAQAARDTGVAERTLAGTPPPGHESSRPTVASRHPKWQLTVRHSRESGNPRVVGVNVGYPSRPPNSERYRRVALRLTIRLRRWYVFRWLTGARAFCRSETRRRRITTASIMNRPGGAPFNPGQERLPSAEHGPSLYLFAFTSPS